MLGSIGFGFDTGWVTYILTYFPLLIILLIVEKFSKCSENGIDRLQNGQLQRHCFGQGYTARIVPDKRFLGLTCPALAYV